MTEVASVARSPANNRIPGESSMWFFVIGDLIIFGGYFLAYVWYRGQQPEVFLAGQARVNLGIGVANTIVLLTSSLFVALGTAAARAARTAEALRLFVIALILGAAFPVLKLSEYVPEILAGNTPGTNLFFMYYFVMTGLHLCHVMLGLVILSFVIGDLNGSAAPRMSLIETGATYWHMVDVLWIVLFALLYVMR